MNTATPYMQRELEHLYLRRAALDRLMNSLEEYSLLGRRDREKTSTRLMTQAEESIVGCAVRSWRHSTNSRIDRRASRTVCSSNRT